MTITSLPQRPADDAVPHVAAVGPSRGRYHWLILIVALAGIGWLYLHFAELMLKTNDSLSPAASTLATEIGKVQTELESTQSRMSEKYQHWVPHNASGCFPPLWPWLVANFKLNGWANWAGPEPTAVSIQTPPSTSDTAQDFSAMEARLKGFERILSNIDKPGPDHKRNVQTGKTTNIVVSLIFLMSLGLVASRSLGLPGTINFTILFGFGILLPRAVQFMPDAVYYPLFFICFICAIQLLKSNSAWLHVLFGLCCGLAYLTSTSIELMLACWLLMVAVRWLLGLFQKDDDKPWTCRRQFVGLLGFLFAYVAVIGPYLQENKVVHGSYFHPFKQAWLGEGLIAKGVLTAAPKGEELENWEIEYVRSSKDNSTELAGFQFRPKAAKTAWNSFFKPPSESQDDHGGWKIIFDKLPLYLAVIGGLFLIAIIYAASRRRAWFQDSQAMPKEGVFAILFVNVAFAAHVLFLPSHLIPQLGENLLAVMYAPLAFSILWSAESLQVWADRRGNGGRAFLVSYQLVQLALLAHMCYRLHELYAKPVFAAQLIL